MPKLGMEPIRKDALIKAAIAEVGQSGSLDVTVSKIAKRAGMSSALAHHYFGSKEDIFLAAMRHILARYSREVRGALATALGPRARLHAILRASFSDSNFQQETVGAWLNFWLLAQTSRGARRLLDVYNGRLRSNLRHELRLLCPERAEDLSESLGAMIDGLYLREVLKTVSSDGATVARIAISYVEAELAQSHKKLEV